MKTMRKPTAKHRKPAWALPRQRAAGEADLPPGSEGNLEKPEENHKKSIEGQRDMPPGSAGNLKTKNHYSSVTSTRI